jgi:hypothetical protein
MDNKISFIAGWFLTTASTISAAGVLNAIVLGLLGGFFGLLGKEGYYQTRDYVKSTAPKVKSWWASKIAWVKSKF